MISLKKCVVWFFVLWLGFMTPSLQSAAAGVPDQEEAKSLDELPAHQPEKYYDFAFEQKPSDKVRFSEKLVDLSDLLKEAAKKEAAGDRQKKEHGGFLTSLDSNRFRGFSLKQIHDLLQSASKNKLREYYTTQTLEEMIKIADFLNFLGAREPLNQITYALAKSFIAHGVFDPKTGIMVHEKQIIPDIQRLIDAHILELKPANLFPHDLLERWKLVREASIISSKTKIIPNPNTIYSVSWSPDGKQLAYASDNDTIQILNATTGQPEKTLKKPNNTVTSLSWSPDGKQLAFRSYLFEIGILNVANGNLEQSLKGHTGFVHSLSWSPDGKLLASGSDDKTVRIWNGTTGELEKTLEGHTKKVTSVSWSPNGKQLASASNDKTIRIWNGATGQLEKILEGNTADVTSVSWIPDGKQLASGSEGGIIYIWNVATGQIEKKLRALPVSGVMSVSCSPDGKQLASGFVDAHIRIWNIATGQIEKTLKGHTKSVFSVTWSPDGQQLASGSWDTTVRIWNIDAIEKALKKINNLTFEEFNRDFLTLHAKL